MECNRCGGPVREPEAITCKSCRQAIHEGIPWPTPQRVSVPRKKRTTAKKAAKANAPSDDQFETPEETPAE